MGPLYVSRVDKRCVAGAFPHGRDIQLEVVVSRYMLVRGGWVDGWYGCLWEEGCFGGDLKSTPFFFFPLSLFLSSLFSSFSHPFSCLSPLESPSRQIVYHSMMNIIASDPMGIGISSYHKTLDFDDK